WSPNIHRSGGEPAKAGVQQLLGLKPGKTIAKTGRAKRAAEFRDELRIPTETTQRGSRAPAPILSGATRPTAVALAADGMKVHGRKHDAFHCHRRRRRPHGPCIGARRL